IFASLVGAAFNAIHCAGWSFIFPSNIESVLWRVCSIIITAYPIYIVDVFTHHFFPCHVRPGYQRVAYVTLHHGLSHSILRSRSSFFIGRSMRCPERPPTWCIRND
ncbi:hypothetical protein CPB84DRAFT_1678992, partial [Gymnopilus junonius]